MPRRVFDRPLPDVRTIDLRNEFQNRGPARGASAGHLHWPYDEALADGGQVILLLNRRGYSTHCNVPRAEKSCAVRIAISP